MGSAVVRGAVAGVIGLAIAAALLDRAGWATVELPRLAGHGAWHFSRVTGFTAFVALALDVTLGLLLSTRAGDRLISRAGGLDLHRWLSPLAIALTVAHGAVLLADRYMAFDALDVLVPFVSAYRPVAVGLGVIAAYLTVVVHVSFALRSRLGARTWRRLHYLSFVAFAGAAVHALAAGTDASRPWALAVIAAPALVVGLLVVRRVLPQ